MTKDLNFQLGTYVGEYIIMTILPTLSTDMLKSRNVINVSDKDNELHKKVSDDLNKSYKIDGKDGKSEFFNIYKKLNHKLAKKYLKNKIECRVPKIYPENMDLFKEGLETSLWNCDLSWYWIEKDYFKQTTDGAWCSYIILTLKIDD